MSFLRTLNSTAVLLILAYGLGMSTTGVSFSLINQANADTSGQKKKDSIASQTTAIPRQHLEDPDDPSRDGWDTEAFNLQAGKQLKGLGKLLTADRPLQGDDVVDLSAEIVSGEPLLPETFETVYQDDVFKIQHYRAGKMPKKNVSSGRDAFASDIESLFSLFRNAKDIRHKAKIIRVKKDTGGFTTTQLFSCAGTLPQGMLEQHSTWEIDWIAGDADVPPKIRHIRVKEVELVQTRQTSGALFSDCTESVLGTNPSYETQLLKGMNHWFQRCTTMRYERRDGGYDFGINTPGIAIGDINGDGLEDFYLCQENGLPNRLFLHGNDGTVLDVAKEWGVDWLQDSRSALLIDFDNDGDQDLFVAIRGGIVLAENVDQDHFRFKSYTKTSNDVMSLAAADYDEDGDLDIYACAYNRNLFYEPFDAVRDTGAIDTFIVHDANNGAKNSLLRNDGNGAFTDVTGRVGLDENNHRYSYGAAWEDFDNDGDLDIYIANDFGRDNLYRNDGGTFRDISDAANIENSAAGMGITWADYDRDGWMDVYVSNMWSSAGRRITNQPKFHADDPNAKDRLRRSARGNTLLHNLKDGSFTDRSGPANVELGRWAWGNQFFDLNNDGWKDLIVANGFLTGIDDSGDL